MRHLWLDTEVIKTRIIIMVFSDTVIARQPREKTHSSYDTDLLINVEYET